MPARRGSNCSLIQQVHTNIWGVFNFRMILIQELACCHVEVEGSTAITLTQCGQKVLKRMSIREPKHDTEVHLALVPYWQGVIGEGDAETPFSALEEWPYWGSESAMSQLLLGKSKGWIKNLTLIWISFFSLLQLISNFFSDHILYIYFFSGSIDLLNFWFWKKFRVLFFLNPHFFLVHPSSCPKVDTFLLH